MAPRTRMTAEEAAASREAKRKDWEQRTGLKLLTKDPAEEQRSNRRRLRDLLQRNQEATPDEGR